MVGRGVTTVLVLCAVVSVVLIGVPSVTAVVNDEAVLRLLREFVDGADGASSVEVESDASRVKRREAKKLTRDADAAAARIELQGQSTYGNNFSENYTNDYETRGGSRKRPTEPLGVEVVEGDDGLKKVQLEVPAGGYAVKNTKHWLDLLGSPRRLPPAAWCTRDAVTVAVPTEGESKTLFAERAGWSTWSTDKDKFVSGREKSAEAFCGASLEFDFFETEAGMVDAWVGEAGFGACGGYSVFTDTYAFYTNIFRAPGLRNNVVVTCACPLPEADFEYCLPSAQWEERTNAEDLWEEEGVETLVEETANSELETPSTGEEAEKRKKAAQHLARAVAGGYPLNVAATAGEDNEFVVVIAEDSRLVFESHAYGIEMFVWPWRCSATCDRHDSMPGGCQQPLIVGGCPVSPQLEFEVLPVYSNSTSLDDDVHPDASSTTGEARSTASVNMQHGIIVFAMKLFAFESDVEDFGSARPMQFECEMRLYEEVPQVDSFCDLQVVSAEIEVARQPDADGSSETANDSSRRGGRGDFAGTSTNRRGGNGNAHVDVDGQDTSNPDEKPVAVGEFEVVSAFGEQPPPTPDRLKYENYWKDLRRRRLQAATVHAAFSRSNLDASDVRIMRMAKRVAGRNRRLRALRALREMLPEGLFDREGSSIRGDRPNDASPLENLSTGSGWRKFGTRGGKERSEQLHAWPSAKESRRGDFGAAVSAVTGSRNENLDTSGDVKRGRSRRLQLRSSGSASLEDWYDGGGGGYEREFGNSGDAFAEKVAGVDKVIGEGEVPMKFDRYDRKDSESAYLSGMASDSGHAANTGGGGGDGRGPIFEEVKNEYVYDDWHVVWRRDQFGDETQVGVGNWFGYVDVSDLNGSGGNIVQTGWGDVLVETFVDNFGTSYGAGVRKGDYGVLVTRDNESFASGINVVARGVEVGTLADVLDRDYGQRIKVRDFDLSIRHDFDEYLYQDYYELATEVRMIWRDVDVIAVSDIVDTEYGVSVGIKGYRMSVLRDFDDRKTDFTGNWGNGWKLALAGNFRDYKSDAMYGKVGFGKLGRAYVSAGAGVGADGLPIGKAEVLTTDVGLQVDFSEHHGHRFFNYALTVGKFTYIWDSKILPENIRVPVLLLPKDGGAIQQPAPLANAR